MRLHADHRTCPSGRVLLRRREEFVVWLDDLLRDFAAEAKRSALSDTEG